MKVLGQCDSNLLLGITSFWSSCHLVQSWALANLLKDANRRKFDLVAAWPVERLGPFQKDLLSFPDEVHALGIALYLLQQGSDTPTPASKAMFQMCAEFAVFERSIIWERKNVGFATARANGKRLGRPKVDETVEHAFRDALSRGQKGIRKIARKSGVGISVVQRTKLDLPTTHTPAAKQSRSVAP